VLVEPIEHFAHDLDAIRRNVPAVESRVSLALARSPKHREQWLQLQVAGAMHFPHAARADRVEDLVRAEPRSCSKHAASANGDAQIADRRWSRNGRLP
jgi:hypothetical protein